MTAAELLTTLNLPELARVERRVPKTLLYEHGAPTVADKRRISDGIEQLHWVAALKPTTIGVSECRDSIRQYVEIAVLHLTLRPEAQSTRLVELVHRAVPYPLLLLTEQGADTELSTAHKRWSQVEADKTVLDGDVVRVDWSGSSDDQHIAAFLDALALGKQPRGSLFFLYQGWMDCIHTLLAARSTGTFNMLNSPNLAAARRHALQECAQLELEVIRLRNQAAKETQLARQVELNLDLKRVQNKLALTRKNL